MSTFPPNRWCDIHTTATDIAPMYVSKMVSQELDTRMTNTNVVEFDKAAPEIKILTDE